MNEWLGTHVPPLVLALMGGIADYLTSDDHSWSNMFIGIFLAGFCGYMVLLLCIEWNLSEGWEGVICGISGLSSRAILNILKKIGIRKIIWMLQTSDDSDSDKDGGKK